MYSGHPDLLNTFLDGLLSCILYYVNVPQRSGMSSIPWYYTQIRGRLNVPLVCSHLQKRPKYPRLDGLYRQSAYGDREKNTEKQTLLFGTKPITSNITLNCWI
jgi:hypothetical protein